MVDNIVELGWFSYTDGKKRQYLNACKLKTADYCFELNGIAEKKGASLAHSIADELSLRLGEDYVKQDETYVFSLSDKHPGYVVSYSHDDVTIKTTFAE